MQCASRALVWVRKVLFGPSPPDWRTPRETTAVLKMILAPSLPNPSPELWAAILAGARRRRASCPWPPTDVPAITAEDITSTLVGAYLLQPAVRQRARAAARLAEESCR